MINYSITMRSVNSNLIADAEFNLVASRSAQAAVIKAIKEGKANVDLSTPTTPGDGSDGGGSNPSQGTGSNPSGDNKGDAGQDGSVVEVSRRRALQFKAATGL